MLTRNLAAEPFTVGVAVPLTGDLAAYGTAIQNGFALSREDFPSSTVQMTFEDNRYDAKESLSAYRRLVDQKRVNLLFSWGETPLQSIAPLIERNAIPTIAMSLDPIPAYNKKWIVLSLNHPADIIGVLHRELRRRSIRSVGFVLTEDPFLKALHGEFVAAQESGESSEIIGTVAPGEMDFRTLALKASKAKYGAIGVYLLSGQVQAFYREAARIGFSPRSFGTDVFENRDEIAAAGKAMQGGLYPNLAVPVDFHRRYVEAFKSDNQVAFAYNAFIIGRWIHSTFGGTPGASLKVHDNEAILTSILNGSYGDGISVKRAKHGSIHISFPVVVREVQGGEFRDL